MAGRKKRGELTPDEELAVLARAIYDVYHRENDNATYFDYLEDARAIRRELANFGFAVRRTAER